MFLKRHTPRKHIHISHATHAQTHTHQAQHAHTHHAKHVTLNEHTRVSHTHHEFMHGRIYTCTYCGGRVTYLSFAMIALMFQMIMSGSKELIL